MCLGKSPDAAPTPALAPKVTQEADVEYGSSDTGKRKKKRQSVTSQHRRNLSINTGGQTAGALNT